MTLGLSNCPSLLSFVLAGWLVLWVLKQPSEDETVNRIGALIQQGAKTFLQKESLGMVCVVASILIILFLPRPFGRVV